MQSESRPWGEFFILDEGPTHKVKRILVKPGERMSYQYHHHRKEAWTVISGTATVTLEGEILEINPGETVIIPLGHKHRVQNSKKEDLVFIEVQTGTYFGEDDIVRLDDDYQRL